MGYLKFPWSVEDTIENLCDLKEIMQQKVIITNLHGRGEKDAEEVAFDFDRAINALKENQEYKKLGTLEQVRDAVEKQKAKKPKIKKNKHSDAYLCPKCGSRIISKDETGWFAGENYYYCCFCGQHIDWSVEQ